MVVITVLTILTVIVTGGDMLKKISTKKARQNFGELMEQLERVLADPKLVKRHGLAEEELEEFIAGLLVTTSLIEKETMIKVVKESPWGNTYLSCALNGRADFIISEDEHLLNLGEYQGTQIISPVRFLDIMEKEL